MLGFRSFREFSILGCTLHFLLISAYFCRQLVFSWDTYLPMSHSYRGFITIAEYKKKIRMDYSPKLDFVGFYGVRRRSQTLKLSNFMFSH